MTSLLPENLLFLLHSLPLTTSLKWAALAVISIVILIILTLEQRRMYRYYHRLSSHASSQDTAAMEYSLKLLSLSSRNRMLFALSFIVLILSVVFYDIKQQLADLDVAGEVPAPAPAAIACEPAPQPPIAVETTAPKDDVNDQALDRIKRDYEQAYVNFYILHKCKVTDINDISLMNSAFLQDLSKLKATASFPLEVRATAKSTFDELYSKFDCNSPTLPQVKKNHQDYLEGVRKSLSAHFSL